MNKVLEIFVIDGARIYLRQGDARELVLVAHQGIPSDVFMLNKYEVGRGRLGRAVEMGEPMMVEAMATDPVYEKLALNKAMLRAGFRSSFTFP
jgi:hypothetical protein